MVRRMLSLTATAVGVLLLPLSAIQRPKSQKPFPLSCAGTPSV
jgi:hypothetical protein